MCTSRRGGHFTTTSIPFLLLYMLTLCSAGTSERCDSTKDGHAVLTTCTGLTGDTFEDALRHVTPETTNLTITDSTLTRLSIGQFNLTNLASVTWILIGPCEIYAVADEAFVGLHNLVYIFIKDNPFYNGPHTTEWKTQLPNLKEFHISGSSMKYLQGGYFNGGTYEVLDLSRNHIELIVDEAFRHCSFIKYLDLSNNWLLTISEGSFDGLSNLIHLDISSNIEVFDSIYIAERPLRKLSKLENLNIANTSRDGILPRDLLSGPKQLKYLNMSNINLKGFPDERLMPVARTLVSLDLSVSTIPSLKPTNFESFSGLQELHLSDAHIRRIDEDVFSHFVTNLVRLDLSDNPYLGLEGLRLYRLRRLLFLNLRGLLMGTISDSFFKGLEGLKEVNLSNNNMTQINRECLHPIAQAKVNLSENPWICDCYMLPFKSWILKEKLSYDIKCDSPSDVRGQQLKDVNDSKLCRVPYIEDCCHQTVETYDGNDVTVRCVSWGDPQPIVTWEVLGGNPFPHNRTLFADNNQTLVLKDLTIENSGNFSCTSSNKMGTTEKVFELVVLQSAVLEYAEIIAIACVCGIIAFALIWLGCFLMLKQKHFVYKPYVDDDSHEERDYLNRGIQVRV